MSQGLGVLLRPTKNSNYHFNHMFLLFFKFRVHRKKGVNCEQISYICGKDFAEN